MSTPPSLYPCPACGAGANLSTGCPRCGRAPDPVAAEVVRLDGEIVALTGRVEQARQAYTALNAALDDLRRRRADLAAQVRAAMFASRTVAPVAAAPVPRVAPVAAAPQVPPVRPEASTRAVQNLLFVLGGLLLCTAAVVFMVVTWSVVGVAGRAAILAGITGLVLAAPPLAKRRGLTATAETFSVVGLLLVALDGYAAWSVNLFGVAGWPGASYAALVWGVSAAAATGYRRLTRLWAPWFTALVFAQPVLPLLASRWEPDAAGWALVFAALAAFNLAVVHTTRTAGRNTARPVDAGPGEPDGAGVRVGDGGADGTAPGGVALARQVLGWVAYAAALAAAGLCGLVALLVADGPGMPALAGGPLLVAVAVLVAGAVLTRNAGFQAAAGLVVVIGLAGTVLRPVSEWAGSFLLLASGLVVAGLAVAVALTGPRLPAGVRGGPRVGGLLLGGVLALVVGTMTLSIAYEAATRSLPVWRGTGTGPVSILDWQVSVTALLVAVALAVLLPRPAREPIGVLGIGLAVLAIPAGVALPWWALAAVELTVAAVLLATAVRVPAPGAPTLLVRAGTGTVLVGHAFLLGLARPGSAAAVLGAILVIGVGVAVLAGNGSQERLAGVRRAIGGTALGVGLLAVPGVVTVGLFAAGVEPWWQSRAALASGVLLLGAVAVLRRRRPYLLPYADTALAVTALVTGLSPLFSRTGEPVGLYSAVGLLLPVGGLYLTGLLGADRTAVHEPAVHEAAGRGAAGREVVGVISPGLFGVPVLAFAAVLGVAPAIGAVLLGPYGWLGRSWSGAPAGVGLAPTGWPVDGPSGAALVVLAVTATLAGWGWYRTITGATLAGLPLAATALLVVLAGAGARWPVVPAVALLGGLAALLVATVPTRRTAASTGAGPAGRTEGPGGSGTALLGGAGTALLAGVGGGLVLVPLGVVLAGAGLAGALPTEATTLVALGLVVLTGSAIGAGAADLVTGRAPVARVAGWLAAIGAGLAFAVAASRAADLPLRLAAFAVLGVAAVALAGGAVLRGRRPVESVAVEAAAHAGAVVALLLTTGAIRYAAAVATLWGVAVGLRALRPGEPARRRAVLAAVAVGCELLAVWLLLTSAQVALLEAYTLPAALCALIVGALALRARPALSSWVTYGPGLTAALLPSLASILVAGDQPWRRLLLGVGALVVVLAGAHWRRQAPAVLGGATLAIAALYEVVGAWDRLPRWIFLALGGLALIGLAITYERRRRDLARWRAAVGRMS
ncbi:SCO7613 C-terminal domain-containing membrane protein [Micromonospora sp. NPDC004704]